MTCHPRLGGALEEGGGHRNYYTDFIFWQITPRREGLCGRGYNR